MALVGSGKLSPAYGWLSSIQITIGENLTERLSARHSQLSICDPKPSTFAIVFIRKMQVVVDSHHAWRRIPHPLLHVAIVCFDWLEILAIKIICLRAATSRRDPARAAGFRIGLYRAHATSVARISLPTAARQDANHPMVRQCL